MAVTTETKEANFVGNGSARSFPIMFPFLRASDIQASQTVDDVTTILSGWSISGTGIGSTITLVAAVPNGATLNLKRVMTLTQETNFANLGAFLPENHEKAFDNAAMQVQHVDGKLADIAAVAAAAGTSVAAVQTAMLATLATELATIRAEFTTQPGSVIDARTILATLGITARTSAAHMADKLNINDFGAAAPGTGAANDTAIAAALGVVDFAYVPRGTYAIATMPDLSRLYGPGVLSLGGVEFPLGGYISPTVPQNVYPNSQWQVASGHGVGTKMNHQGTGTHAALSITAYETGTNTPLCTCADVAQLKVGDLVAFNAPADICFRITLVEVIEVGGGGFRVLLPLGLKPTTSQACLAVPSMSGGTGTLGSGASFDWWSKTHQSALTGTATWTNGSNQVIGVGTAFTTELEVGTKIKTGLASVYATVLTVDSDTAVTLSDAYAGSTELGVATYRTGAITWREDNAVNTRKGSKYSCGFKKALGPAEHLSHVAPVRDLPRYLGQRLVCGFGVMHKVRNGAGTWRVFVNTNGTGGGLKYSTSSTAPVGVFDWRELTFIVPEDATYFISGVEFEGAAGDVYYVTHPMMAFGRYLGPWNYSQPKGEYLVPIVHAQFMSIINTTFNMPTTLADADGKGVDGDLYGTDNNAYKTFAVSPYAETNGIIAPTVKEVVGKLEGRCGSEGDAFGFSNNYLPGAAHVFGMLMYSVRSGFMMQPQKCSIPLDDNGRFHVIEGMIPLTGTVTFTNGSATVIGVGTRFLSELSNGMFIKQNTNSGAKFYKVKARASDTSLTLGVPGGADATFDEATAVGAGALKMHGNFYNLSLEGNAYLLS